MLKKSFLINFLMFIFVGLSLSANAQNEKDIAAPILLQKDAETGLWQYSEVIQIDSTKLDKQAAYKNAKDYLQSKLKTSDNNIVINEQDFSKLINSGNLTLKPIMMFGHAVGSPSVDFKIKLSFKSGRYKILIDNLVFRGVYSTGATQTYDEIRNDKSGKKFKEDFNETLTAFVNGLKDAVVNKNGAKEDKW